MSPGPDPTKGSETRRAHKKSRTGCLVCKQRRVKCDEARPQCGKCAIGGWACSYVMDQAPGSAVSVGSEGGTRHGFISPDFSALTGRSISQLNPSDEDRPCGHFTTFHMTLLFHASTEHNGFVPALGHSQLFISKALESAQSAPYYLEQLLALSALHLSTINPDTQAVFRQQATALQKRSLAMFNAATEHPEGNLQANFMFTAMVGMQVLSQTLSDHMSSLDDFLGAFVNYTRIHRGVRAVISTRREDLLSIDLGPMLRLSEGMIDYQADVKSGPETMKLHSQLEQMAPEDGSSSVSKTRLEALFYTQNLIDFGRTNAGAVDRGVNAVTVWPMLVTEEYADALYQHRPEALAVMAFYAVMMHKNSHYWLFSGRVILLAKMIVAHVGPFWAEALAWPMQVISGREEEVEAVDFLISQDGSSVNRPMSQ